MAKSKNKGSSETKKPKKSKQQDNRPHMQRARESLLNGGTGSSAQNAAARG